MKTTVKSSFVPIILIVIGFIFFNMFHSINLFSQVVKFAAIGDYGYYLDTNEVNVANLVKSWNPNFIITLGDNNYEDGCTSTIDLNIGQYYSDYISNYKGNFGKGAGDTNKFWPCLGNHDIYTGICNPPHNPSDTNQYALPYRNYFTLFDNSSSGNERYYDFVEGNIHFFVLNSDVGGWLDGDPPQVVYEWHGLDSSSFQANWLRERLAVSTSRWNIVYFHHPPYNSLGHDSKGRPYDTLFQEFRWPFQRWGAHIVLNGHVHLYDRQNVNNFTYIINGCGGKYSKWWDDLDSTSSGEPIFSSNTRAGFVDNFGAQFIESYNDSVVFSFINTNNILKDKYILLQPKTIRIKCFIEGFYNSVSNHLISDSIRVTLRKKYSPYTIVDSVTSLLDILGNGIFTFPNAVYDTSYYVIVNHRNSIETWSKNPAKLTNELTYNFTSKDTMAYGNNMIEVDQSPLSFAIYSGDVNQDGIVDASDSKAVNNDALNFVTGYVNTDLTGDEVVDASDGAIVENNAFNFVGVIKP